MYMFSRRKKISLKKRFSLFSTSSGAVKGNVSFRYRIDMGNKQIARYNEVSQLSQSSFALITIC